MSLAAEFAGIVAKNGSPSHTRQKARAARLLEGAKIRRKGPEMNVNKRESEDMGQSI
jgi:hypothetical protein